jgi:hypothetical protein
MKPARIEFAPAETMDVKKRLGGHGEKIRTAANRSADHGRGFRHGVMDQEGLRVFCCLGYGLHSVMAGQKTSFMQLPDLAEMRQMQAVLAQRSRADEVFGRLNLLGLDRLIRGGCRRLGERAARDGKAKGEGENFEASGHCWLLR